MFAGAARAAADARLMKMNRAQGEQQAPGAAETRRPPDPRRRSAHNLMGKFPLS